MYRCDGYPDCGFSGEDEQDCNYAQVKLQIAEMVQGQILGDKA